MNRRALALASIAAAFLAPLIESCALGGFEKGELTPLLGGAGGVSLAGGGGAGGSAPACVPATFPDPPADADAGGDEDFVVALHEIFFTKNGVPAGVDLDRRCTCTEETGGSCVSPPQHQLLDADFSCDLEGGRDNGFAKLAEKLKLFLNIDLPATYTAAANAGEWSALIVVRGYNGQSNDAAVRVEWLQAGGFGEAQPSWDGSDVWPVSATSFEVDAMGMPDPGQPKHVDPNAFVHEGLLVANLPTSPIIFASGAGSASQGYFELGISSGGLVATIAGEAGARSLEDGVMAGVIGEEAIFTAIGTFRDDNGGALCPGETSYELGLGMFCGARDSHDDVVGPTTPCNGISFGIGFRADAVLLGSTTPPILPGPSTCAPGGAGPQTACPDDAEGGAGGAP